MQPGRSSTDPMKQNKAMLKTLVYPGLLVMICIGLFLFYLLNASQLAGAKPVVLPSNFKKATKLQLVALNKEDERICYGRELVKHTAKYFGPKGSIAAISNGMNCQNCHLDAGTRPFGNNYAAVAANYPRISARSGKVETAATRISECFKRSLGGKAPDTTTREIKAMAAYINSIGMNVKKWQSPVGSTGQKLAYPDHAADPIKGKAIYLTKCNTCHGSKGEGLINKDNATYVYPPLWGKHSYNDGAGMHRLSKLASFVKNNMPYGATYNRPQLSDDEAWNVAAFINTQARPHKDQRRDWPNLKKKPLDYPFGPYADNFSEHQHKLGPFKPIEAFYR